MTDQIKPATEDEVERLRDTAVDVRTRHASEIPDHFICLNLYLNQLKALIARIDELKRENAENIDLRARLTQAVNSLCSCGGKGPNDTGVCDLCRLYHATIGSAR